MRCTYPIRATAMTPANPQGRSGLLNPPAHFSIRTPSAPLTPSAATPRMRREGSVVVSGISASTEPLARQAPPSPLRAPRRVFHIVPRTSTEPP